jgi:hypothetical protein
LQITESHMMEITTDSGTTRITSRSEAAVVWISFIGVDGFEDAVIMVPKDHLRVLARALQQIATEIAVRKVGDELGTGTGGL